MSFNQLPEELVAQVVSHVRPEDMVNLLQTQKRVNRIMKKYRMDKPAVQQILLDFYKNYGLIPTMKFTWQSFGNKYKKNMSDLVKDLYGKQLIEWVLTKFGNIDWLIIISDDRFNLDNELASMLTNSKTKMKTVSLIASVDLNIEEFSNFCMSDFSVNLDCEARPDLFCDDVLCRIFSKSKFRFSLRSNEPENVTLDLSDRWLETMTSCNTRVGFSMDGVQTKFTIGGIRRYIEESFSNGWELYFFIGFLAAEQREFATEWMNFANENIELDYFIKAETYARNREEMYSVNRKSNPDEKIASFVFKLDM